MIRVLLAEDMELIRGAIVALMGLESDLTVVAEVASGEAAVAAALEHRPDVAVLDVHMPGELDGLAAAGVLAERLPECRVLILTSLGRPETLRQALASQASGFMLKDAPPAQLAEAIRRVVAGERVLDPDLAAQTIMSRPNPLSEREIMVLRMAADGLETAQIASTLYLSKGTVRNYLGAIVTKLSARNRLDAVRIATEAGWL
ncbi:response regulator transcription factor [Nonomuraea sp. KC401]|uniref:Response regulator transcription factor n=1 Tax=Nonomuraea longispora TaxID=1848320 RepID=A0A4R4NEL7_9ACTN|nr:MULTISPECIES: response regulator transcription factor [Nonomuraea]NBE99130.1 response regulator [Nonomuraea sp. K271]TDC05667.1 response regulator transcription factor [Nonomuraea longispora]TLF58185.1 response regulator transcription factor [Nonomuraea sp. KC401]